MGKTLSYLIVLIFGFFAGSLFFKNSGDVNTASNDSSSERRLLTKKEAYHQAKKIDFKKLAEIMKTVPVEKDDRRLKVPVGNSPIKGNPNAEITIVEFSDFECPFCARVNPTLSKLLDKYGDKIRVVFKHNALPFHKNAEPAARASIAAQRQGKFWQYHDLLFANMKKLGKDDLIGYAKQLNLDIEKFKQDMDSESAKQHVKDDMVLAGKVGARGTPNMFINGIQLVGAQPINKFSEVIDAQLKVTEKLKQKSVPTSYIYEMLMKSAKEKAPPPKPRKPQAPAAQDAPQIVPIEHSPADGDDSSLVTIVEFSDFECPFCTRAAKTMKEIKAKYGTKVRIVFKHQPLGFHKQAKPAAIASMAAHKQGKFWEYHDLLFENGKSLNDSIYEELAKKLGLDIAKFNSDRKDPAVIAMVDKDQKLAGLVGARGTPTSFVNGKKVRGAQPLSGFAPVIDAEMARAEKLLKEGVKQADLYMELMKRGKTEIPRVKLEVGASPFKGSEKAKVTIIEFSSFDCPFCSRVNPTIQKILDKYGNNVKIVFKNFLRNAAPAHKASYAAMKQGKFWEYHDKLFANQRAMARDNLISYAKDLGLDEAKFVADMDSPAADTWLQADVAESRKGGVSGVPAFFINGRKLVGAQPFAAFEAVIDEELKLTNN